MKKTVLTSAQAAYEAPLANILEFAVEGGFTLTGVDADGFDKNDGTESLGRDDVSGWY